MSAEFGFPGWLSLFFFSFFAVLAWVRPLDWKHRLIATLMGVVAIGLLFAVESSRSLATVRQLLPLLLMPMAYWQTGQFTAPINERMQKALSAIDRKIFGAFRGVSLPPRIRSWLLIYLECAYLLV